MLKKLGLLLAAATLSLAFAQSMRGPRWIPPAAPPASQPQRPVGLISGRPSPFGNILYPGTGGPPGTGIYGSGPNGPRRSNVSPILYPGIGVGSIGIPFGSPLVVGGGYGYGGSVDYQLGLNDTGNGAQVPTVVINQNFVGENIKPVVRDYGDLPETRATPDSRRYASTPMLNADTLYRIAFRDGSEQKAIGYAMEGDTLTFVSERGRVTRVTLDLVDVEKSVMLNKQLDLDFRVN